MSTQVRRICEGNEVDLSLTGNHLYIGNAHGGGYVSKFPDLNPKLIHSKGYRARWSPSGKVLAITNNISGTPYGVHLYNPDTH